MPLGWRSHVQLENALGPNNSQQNTSRKQASERCEREDTCVLEKTRMRRDGDRAREKYDFFSSSAHLSARCSDARVLRINRASTFFFLKEELARLWSVSWNRRSLNNPEGNVVKGVCALRRVKLRLPHAQSAFRPSAARVRAFIFAENEMKYQTRVCNPVKRKRFTECWIRLNLLRELPSDMKGYEFCERYLLLYILQKLILRYSS